MRQIKFRAWDKDESLMTYLDLGNKNPDVSRLHIALLSDHLREPWGEVMQFTGLHDKNGKEIFEGDIIIDSDWVDDEDRTTYIVMFGEFELENHYHMVGFYVSGDDLDYSINLLFKEECEVIGNIYENPELVGGTKKALENEGQKNCK